MRIATGSTNKYIYFTAISSLDLKTRKTGLTAFTVYRSRNGGTPVAMVTPTVVEVDATYMPGVYALLLDEDTTIAASSTNEEMALDISCAGMVRVTRAIELYRPPVTEGQTLEVTSGIGSANVKKVNRVSVGGHGLDGDEWGPV